jgi:hypothetical protein
MIVNLDCQDGNRLRTIPVEKWDASGFMVQVKPFQPGAGSQNRNRRQRRNPCGCAALAGALTAFGARGPEGGKKPGETRGTGRGQLRENGTGNGFMSKGEGPRRDRVPTET